MAELPEEKSKNTGIYRHLPRSLRFTKGNEDFKVAFRALSFLPHEYVSAP
jgi:hypothetical protein